jgi:hypothetical protein
MVSLMFIVSFSPSFAAPAWGTWDFALWPQLPFRQRTGARQLHGGAGDVRFAPV